MDAARDIQWVEPNSSLGNNGPSYNPPPTYRHAECRVGDCAGGGVFKRTMLCVSPAIGGKGGGQRVVENQTKNKTQFLDSESEGYY